MKKRNVAFMSLFALLANQQVQAIDFTTGLKSAAIACLLGSSSANNLRLSENQQQTIADNTESSAQRFLRSSNRGHDYTTHIDDNYNNDDNYHQYDLKRFANQQAQAQGWGKIESLGNFKKAQTSFFSTDDYRTKSISPKFYLSDPRDGDDCPHTDDNCGH